MNREKLLLITMFGIITYYLVKSETQKEEIISVISEKNKNEDKPPIIINIPSNESTFGFKSGVGAGVGFTVASIVGGRYVYNAITEKMKRLEIGKFFGIKNDDQEKYVYLDDDYDNIDN